MSEKATGLNANPKISAQNHANSQSAALRSLHPSANPFLGLEQTVGNQAMLQLFESGAIQAKLRVSRPGDPDELEADRLADQVVSATHAPRIHRKCACEGSGSPCSTCAVEQAGTIHRSVASPLLRPSSLAIQRAPATDGAANAPDQVGNPVKPSPTPAHTHPLVVEDDAKSVAPHQMRKSAFIALLRTDACATADAVLESVGHTTKSCPYIEKWLGFYEKQSASHIERAILKYAPETATARSAHEAIRLVVMRVQRAAMTWAKTGKVSGLPEEVASQIPGQGGFLGAIRNFASTGVGGAILGFIGGHPPDESAGPGAKPVASDYHVISRKVDGNGVSADAAPAHDADAARSQLGAGDSLDSHLQSQMSAAFGHDFSGVRVHTDSRAATLSSNLNARAFTIGTDVAFASGEYRPGTLIGDALIAHELAHVVQQQGARHTGGPISRAAQESSQYEREANFSAASAVASAWFGASAGISAIYQNVRPRLRGGLRLQRCSHKGQVKQPAAPVAPVTPAEVEPAAPKFIDSVSTPFKDLSDGKTVSDPTGRNHGITIERRGDELFYTVPNQGTRRVPRPLDDTSKPPKRTKIDTIRWAGSPQYQTAFSVSYDDLLAFPYMVNIFGMAQSQSAAGFILRQPPALEVRPEGLETEREAGTIAPLRPKGKRFEEAFRYHMPDSPFSLYIFTDYSAEVAADPSGKVLGGPWSKILNVAVTPTGDVDLTRNDKKGGTTSHFSLKGPAFTSTSASAAAPSQDRVALLAKIQALGVNVVERGRQFTDVELQAALDTLNRWKGTKSVVDSLKAAGVPGLKLIKDLVHSEGEYSPLTGELHISGPVEMTDEEQKSMMIHELTHTMFQAAGLIPPKDKVPDHIKNKAAELKEASDLKEITEGLVQPYNPHNKPRTQEEWEKALSTDPKLNNIWGELHHRFPIGDPEGTGDIRGMDVADESRYLGDPRGDVVGHAFDNTSEFMASFVNSSTLFQSRMSTTVLASHSEKLARIYKDLWDWTNQNMMSLGNQNPYDAILTKLKKR